MANMRLARRGPIGTTVSLLLQPQRRCLIAPAGPLMPNEPPMACAGPSVRVGPGTVIAGLAIAAELATLDAQ